MENPAFKWQDGKAIVGETTYEFKPDLIAADVEKYSANVFRLGRVLRSMVKAEEILESGEAPSYEGASRKLYDLSIEIEETEALALGEVGRFAGFVTPDGVRAQFNGSGEFGLFVKEGLVVLKQKLGIGA
jgi:hypothetical protein